MATRVCKECGAPLPPKDALLVEQLNDEGLCWRCYAEAVVEKRLHIVPPVVHTEA